MGFLTGMQKNSFLFSLGSLFLVSCIFYAFLPPGNAAFPWFGALYLAQFLLYGGILALLRSQPLHVNWIIGLAVVSRGVLLFTEPTLENDYWRYLWDGRVLANGMNPYAYKPMDIALDHLAVPYRHLIGWKQYGTIYPPFSILVFSITHFVAGDSLIGLKVALTLFDLGTGIVLLAWIKQLGLSPKWSALYFLNPLVLKEIANSAHLDSIAVFFATFAAFLLWRSTRANKTSVPAWIALALAVASKLYPICFVPIFFKIDRFRWRGILLFSLVLAIAYSPFLQAGSHLLNGTEAFAKHWIFNASLYRIYQNGVPLLLGDFGWAAPLLEEDRLAKLIVTLLFGAFTLYRASKIRTPDELPSELANVCGALLLLSPVVNAWYVLWVLPFACIARNKTWLVFSFLVVAAYSWWYSRELAFYFRWIEYLVLFTLLFVQYREKMAQVNERSL